jgi:hypothetical protein
MSDEMTYACVSTQSRTLETATTGVDRRSFNPAHGRGKGSRPCVDTALRVGGLCDRGARHHVQPQQKQIEGQSGREEDFSVVEALLEHGCVGPCIVLEHEQARAASV